MNEQGGEARGKQVSRPRAVANQQRIQASKGEIDEALHVLLGDETFDVRLSRTAFSTWNLVSPDSTLERKKLGEYLVNAIPKAK